VKRILSQTGRRVLEQFAWSNALLAFDFDGTLAPIVAEPVRAAMRERTRARLERLTALYPVVIISGRAQADVRARLRGVAVREVIGNHGIEPWQATSALMRKVERWRPALEQRLASLRGVQIEDKGCSVAVHYRHSRAKRLARAAIADAAAALGDTRVIGGKQVVNILPAGSPHKGTALERERRRQRCDTAIYVGDDETDEDVFALDQPGRLLSIRVGSRRASAAPYCIDDQLQIDALLQALIDMRRAFARWDGRRA